MADPIAPPRALGDVEADRLSAWWLLALPCSALLVFAAIVLEVAAGETANSALPAWAHLVPLAWPQWARVLWWLGVAAAAATFRAGLHRIGMRTRRLGDVVAVGPFLVFAAGIAMGADWATWH